MAPNSTKEMCILLFFPKGVINTPASFQVLLVLGVLMAELATDVPLIVVLVVQRDKFLHLIIFLHNGSILIEMDFAPPEILLRVQLFLFERGGVHQQSCQHLNGPFVSDQKIYEKLEIHIVHNGNFETVQLVRIHVHEIDKNVLALRLFEAKFI